MRDDPRRKSLEDLFEEPGKTVLTAHRGWSGQYPENTLNAFEKAVEAGVDIVEFDVRETADGEFVVIHDPTLERTTNGAGPVSQKRLSELKRLNASFWVGPHDTGYRATAPLNDETIPTLEEAFYCLSGTVCMNVQVYVNKPASLEKIVRMYDQHDLYGFAFLHLESFAAADHVRHLNPGVAICVSEERDNLNRHLLFGVDFVQPRVHHLTSTYVEKLKSVRLKANIFYANTREDTEKLLDQGIRGIITDCPDVVSDTIRAHILSRTLPVETET
ncbi:MAG: hypothetical protein GX804_01840 [Lentisphaerae bacterium]|jgi:glycerophosphoryl diester phosphodiesterase|nr:hypothetical protein [Lentisphaerota bacterium]